MRLIFSKIFLKNHKKLIDSNQSLKKQSRKTIDYLSENVNHPSLRLHKLNNKNMWSASVNKSVRIIFQIDNDLVYLIDIGKHEDVY